MLLFFLEPFSSSITLLECFALILQSYMKSTDANYKDFEYVFVLFLSASYKSIDIILPETLCCRLDAKYVR